MPKELLYFQKYSLQAWVSQFRIANTILAEYEDDELELNTDFVRFDKISIDL